MNWGVDFLNHSIDTLLPREIAERAEVFGARTTRDKILAYWPLTWLAVLISVIPVTIGNIMGGGQVGAVYCSIYQRNRAPWQDA